MSKLQAVTERIPLAADEVIHHLIQILLRAGCASPIAKDVAAHLVDADLCGVESHGVMRVLQYIEQFRSGYMRPEAQPVFRQRSAGSYEVNGLGAIGIPAMLLLSALGLVNLEGMT
ncbi:MAG: Ldh family oxidoreductase [Acidiferrobacterales bacterium]|nr:Ldh family oxidoreductase [Acidiferrobacterales bacterium]